ncbi:MAG: adenylate/guanylate cyclase domain-containing protein [Alphaproteobacteria bacterium]|nr:adenylate/guanylate cyclase domain-containing protein [Alphaproteobacteria bacterium]
MGADEVIAWIVREGLETEGPELLRGLGNELRRHGFPVSHLWHSATVGHPMVNAYGITWTAEGDQVEQNFMRHGVLRGILEEHTFPPALVMVPGTRRVALRAEDLPTRYDLINARFAAGATDYVILRTGREEPSIIDDLAVKRARVFLYAFTLTAPEGFDQDGLDRIVGVLDLAMRVQAERFSGRSLLEAYIGSDAAERVWNGQVQRGDHTRVQAAIAFTDLRGFSAMTEALDATDVLDVLDEAFELQVRAIHAHGGHVLKFMGDGLLAIWPDADGCDAALAALDELEVTVEAANTERAGQGKVPIRYGAALHFGEVVYGNIGSTDRLDFTVVGSAVNRAARLESLGAKLGVRPVLSEVAASRVSRPVHDLGSHEAKGVGTVRVFGLAVDGPGDRPAQE